MKIRTDFVTNSSSSSYIVMFKEFPEIDKETIEKYPFLTILPMLFNDTLFSKGSIETDYCLITTEKQLQKWYVLEAKGFNLMRMYSENYYDYDYYDDDNADSKENKLKIANFFKNDFKKLPKQYKKEYNKFLDAIKNGYQIIEREIDYNDAVLKKMLLTLKNDDTFIVEEIY